MALVEENEFMDGVTSVSLAEERLGFYCSSKESYRSLGIKLFDRLGVGILAPGPEGHPLYFSKFIKTLGAGFKPTLTSESYELLRTAAVEGSIVAVLPSRVANRRPNELIEISPRPISKAPDGNYRIYLVSEPGCSAEENEFLAQEIKSLISAQG